MEIPMDALNHDIDVTNVGRGQIFVRSWILRHEAAYTPTLFRFKGQANASQDMGDNYAR